MNSVTGQLYCVTWEGTSFLSHGAEETDVMRSPKHPGCNSWYKELVDEEVKPGNGGGVEVGWA